MTKEEAWKMHSETSESRRSFRYHFNAGWDAAKKEDQPFKYSDEAVRLKLKNECLRVGEEIKKKKICVIRKQNPDGIHSCNFNDCEYYISIKDVDRVVKGE